MQITSFGLFWRRDEIEWTPGSGIKGEFQLLGRVGASKSTLLVCDFRHQQGIYVLYDEYGVSYIGLTRKQGLGKRLKDHTEDELRDKWDRFSWFGFKRVNVTRGSISTLDDIQDELTSTTHTTIGDVEALLIRVVGRRNNNRVMNFNDASKWTQINYDEVAFYLERVNRSGIT